MTLQAVVDFVSQYGAIVWLGLTVPALFVSTIAAGEGHRLVLISEGPAPGARLLRFVGVGVTIVLFAFVLVGVLAILNLVQYPYVQMVSPTSVLVRRLLGSLIFFIAPPTLGLISLRVLRFVAPKP